MCDSSYRNQILSKVILPFFVPCGSAHATVDHSSHGRDIDTDRMFKPAYRARLAVKRPPVDTACTAIPLGIGVEHLLVVSLIGTRQKKSVTPHGCEIEQNDQLPAPLIASAVGKDAFVAVFGIDP